MKTKLILTLLIASFGLTNCASYDFSRRVVQQGNLLPEAKIKRLKIGMSKENVAILMGNSLLSPTFNNDRWDYAYTYRKGNSSTLSRKLSLTFKNNQLIAIRDR